MVSDFATPRSIASRYNTRNRNQITSGASNFLKPENAMSLGYNNVGRDSGISYRMVNSGSALNILDISPSPRNQSTSPAANQQQYKQVTFAGCVDEFYQNQGRTSSIGDIPTLTRMDKSTSLMKCDESSRTPKHQLNMNKRKNSFSSSRQDPGTNRCSELRRNSVLSEALY